jgi:curli biogenesis system outer membrane secretion channel CsgG
MKLIRIAASIAAAAMIAVTLSGCATMDGGSMASLAKNGPSTKAIAQHASAVVTITGPYDAAKQCIAKIPEVKTLTIAVGDIKDDTGKVNVTDGGTGSFIGNGASNMFNATLASLGVKLEDLSPEYRQTIDWMNSKGAGMIEGTDTHGKKVLVANVLLPQLMLLGSVTSLDFLPGTSAEATLFGIGPKTRAYSALGAMKVRLVTLPNGKAPGGQVLATSAPSKQFAAVENSLGFSSFVGAGPGVTYASFDITSGQREPMQYTLGYLADYAAVDMIGTLLENLSAKNLIDDRRPAIAACRALLEVPVYPSAMNRRVASAS